MTKPVNPKMLFVFGAPKTSTSTMVAMLNCHPEIMIFFEAYSSFGEKDNISKFAFERREKFVAKFPSLKEQFNQTYMPERYDELLSVIDRPQYQWIGDKIQGFHFNIMETLSNRKTIFLSEI